MANNKDLVVQAFRSGKKPSEADFHSLIQLATDAGELDRGTLSPERFPANLDLNQQKDITNIPGANTLYSSLSRIAEAMASHASHLADLAQVDNDNLETIRGGVEVSHNNLQKLKVAIDALGQVVDDHIAATALAISQTENNAVSTLRGAVSTTFDTLEKIEEKLLSLESQIAGLQLGSGDLSLPTYVAGISSSSDTVLATTHGQGAHSGLIVQFYDGRGRLLHGVDLINTHGDIQWSISEPVEPGSYVVIRG